jgi:coenzyme F420-reducing hydrogenase beta subunit
VNEDEHGITPANVTAITIDRPGRDWRVIIEQGNGDVIKMFELTEMERVQLACMICTDPGTPPLLDSVGFVDFDR